MPFQKDTRPLIFLAASFGSTVNRCSKISRFAIPNGLIIGSDVHEKIKEFNNYKFKNMNAAIGAESVYSVFLVTRK